MTLKTAIANPECYSHWIYWVGPGLGAIIASGYYRFVKFCHYEEANPGQDASTSEEIATARVNGVYGVNGA